MSWYVIGGRGQRRLQRRDCRRCLDYHRVPGEPPGTPRHPRHSPSTARPAPPPDRRAFRLCHRRRSAAGNRSTVARWRRGSTRSTDRLGVACRLLRRPRRRPGPKSPSVTTGCLPGLRIRRPPRRGCGGCGPVGGTDCRCCRASLIHVGLAYGARCCDQPPSPAPRHHARRPRFENPSCKSARCA